MRPVAFGLWWFLVALLPTSIIPLAEVENDHRMFFPFIGLAAAVAWWIAVRVQRWATQRLISRPLAVSGAAWAAGMLVLTWGVVVGPQVAARFKPDSLLWLADTTWVALIARYAIVIAAIGIQLVAYHLWLAAGQRRLGDVWPGVVLSILLWVIAAQLFASWLTINDYSRFYAGLTRIMSALVFFQVSAIIVIVGAELNRGIVEVKRRLALAEERNADVTTMPLPPSGDSYRVEH